MSGADEQEIRRGARGLLALVYQHGGDKAVRETQALRDAAVRDLIRERAAKADRPPK